MLILKCEFFLAVEPLEIPLKGDVKVPQETNLLGQRKRVGLTLTFLL